MKVKIFRYGGPSDGLASFEADITNWFAEMEHQILVDQILQSQSTVVDFPAVTITVWYRLKSKI